MCQKQQDHSDNEWDVEVGVAPVFNGVSLKHTEPLAKV